MSARVINSPPTPVTSFVAFESPEVVLPIQVANDVDATAQVPVPQQAASVPLENSVLHRAARAWFAVRWRLAETVFAKPIPWITATLELKLGDLLVTLPVAAAFLAYNAWLCAKIEVSKSGTAPAIVMLIVFALTVRNNSILLSLTGLPYERALLYHKFFGVIAILVSGLHGLAYLLQDAGVAAARRRQRRLDRSNDKPGEDEEPTFSTEFSGALIFYMLIALWVLSLGPVRRRFYELFLRAHVLLFIGIVVFSAIHGAGLVVVGAGIWALDMVFRHAYIVPTHYKGSPLALRSSKRMGVIAKEQISVAKLPGDIVRIQFPTTRADTGERFRYEAGQYMFVCIPTLGYLEWHPFTISSAPHEATVTIHIKALGNWTRKLYKLVATRSSAASTEGTGAIPAPFSVLFDGPYGSVSIDIASPKTYSHFALFSGGIGITPMQAIANQLHFEYHHQGRHSIKRVHFVWSVRDRATLQALFSRDAVESKRQQQQEPPSSTPPYLPYVLLTSAGNNKARGVFFSEFFLTKGQREAENPVDQQLQHCLRYDTRPQIRDTLKSLGDDAIKCGKDRVAVLVCGPSTMVKQVVREAILLSHEMNVHFDVHTESFDF